MKKFDALASKLAGKAQGMAENNAVKTSGYFCRLWFGVEKMPKALKEQEIR